MLRLYIDNQLADLDPTSEISISLSMASLTSTSIGRAGYSKSIVIPATPLNRRLMGDCEQPLTAAMFNHTLHTARIEALGSIIIEGTIHLTASRLGRGGYYRFNIIGNSREWLKGAALPLRELCTEWSTTLSEENIEASWTAEEAGSYPLVCFLPVERGAGKGCEGYRGRLLPTDYHPFVNIGRLLEAIFARTGYVVESEFMDSEFFRSLYLSGRWSESPGHSSWAEHYDFKSVRQSDSEWTEANEDGRVLADPLVVGHTVGNLVGVPDPEDGDSYNSGSLMLGPAGRLCFSPVGGATAGFEYRVRYRTGYRILSRRLLKGHSIIHSDFGDKVKLTLANPFVDYRGYQLRSSHIYTLAIFEDIPEGSTCYLCATHTADDGTVTSRLVLHTTTERITQFTNTAEGTLSRLRLEISNGVIIQSYFGDWAIYQGNITEEGTVDVDVTFRSIPKHFTSAAPKYFDMFYFGGADPGTKFKLLAGTSVRPIFYPHPVVGGEIGWHDIMNYYDVTGLDLLSGLRDMFDLQIYTDPLDKKVCIEPRRDYCDPNVVIDLSDRIDTAYDVVVEELGSGGPSEIRLGYRRGDKAVEDYCAAEGCDYGHWSCPVENIFATADPQDVRNKLFAATLDAVGTIGATPSMSLPRVGDWGEWPEAMCYGNFTPKVVSYRGVVPLAEGESLEYPSTGVTHYPLATFFDDGTKGGEPRSLLFEDKDGIEGLHRFWDFRLGSLNHSRRLTLHLTLYPEEIEQIVVPNSTKHDFRAHYLLTIDGEKVLCRMEEIVDYNPSAPSTKVVFVTV